MKLMGMNCLKSIVMVAAMLFAGACSDDDKVVGKGDVEFEITDAPIDDTSVKSVMVTVADVKVNGVSIEGFTRQTIDLKSYNEGNTKLLGKLTMDARTYNNIELVLDLDRDANGNAPGCYVLTAEQTKYKLQSSADGMLRLTLSKSWSVANDATTRVIMDFDLRKSIRYTDDMQARYSFVDHANLTSAIRVVTDAKSGHIKGGFNNEENIEGDKIVVYAYKKGSFNAETETQSEGAEGIAFRNAAGSAEVRQTITGHAYTIAYLEEGEYELHFIAYNRDAQTGRFSYAARLESQTTVDGSVGDIIRVKGSSTINVSSSVKGIF